MILESDGPMTLVQAERDHRFYVVCTFCRTRKPFQYRLDAENYYDHHDHNEEAR
jgi:hypothetical protein